MKRLICPAVLLAVLLVANRLGAGGSGLNVIVVVNQNSSNSLQLGNSYCEQRGVPPQNLLRLTNWSGGAINWSPAEFRTCLLDPLLDRVARRGLTRQAQFVLLSMDIPYRVTDAAGQNSTTSALFYGFKSNGAPVVGIPSCSLPDDSSNSYAFSELPFAQAPPDTATTNSFLAMMLTDTSLAGAERILSRGVAADGSCPTQAVYLAKTTDAARNVRFVAFDNAVFENRVAGNEAVRRIDTNATAFTDLFGLLTGLANFALPTNAFAPGGLGDSLTSFGGEIFESSGQTSLLAFLEAGTAGSYGTVVEPCNYTEKFPDPMDYFYQTRGFSVAEAYYQSIRNPFQGLLVGEPLAAPFARPGSADWSSLTNGAVLKGQIALSLAFTAAPTNRPLAQADLFVDGVFFQTMTNLPPAAGNELSVVLNGFTITYTVPTNATLAAVAAGLAAALNAQSNDTQVRAFPVGDRIELQSLALSHPGSNVTVNVSSTIGAAASLTTRLTAARPDFLDTVATGFQVVTIWTAPGAGDWLQLTCTKTNGDTVTIATTNTTGSTIGTLAQNLVNLINADAALQMADGLLASDFSTGYVAGQPAAQFFLHARTPGWPASQIMTTLTVSSNLLSDPAGPHPLADNVSDLRPRNHLYVSSGADALTVHFTGDTTQWSDGEHALTAVAYEGTSVATQTRVTRRVWVQNTGLSATLTAAGASADQLLFSVTANTNTIARIELFSTGGSVGVVTNQSVASFAVSAAELGVGLHPFYALVTDQEGRCYQTPTSWSMVPSLTLTLAGTPPVLSWPAIPGRQYDVQTTANLTGEFQTLATIVATNGVVQWPISATENAGFYRVQVHP